MSTPTPTPSPAPEQNALDEFKRISDILSVPAVGKPLLSHRKWIVPCLDERAAADLPEPKEKIENWRRGFTACEDGPVLLSPAAQQAKAPEKQAEKQAR